MSENNSLSTAAELEQKAVIICAAEKWDAMNKGKKKNDAKVPRLWEVL